MTFTAAGSCMIDANQAGDSRLRRRDPGPADRQCRPGPPDDHHHLDRPDQTPAVGDTYTPTATASSGLTVAITIDSSSSSVCSISGGLVTFDAAGSCVIDFNQAGNSNYDAATQVQQTVGVGLDSQTITITSTAPTSPAVGDTYTPTADRVLGAHGRDHDRLLELLGVLHLGRAGDLQRRRQLCHRLQPVR